MSGSSGPGTYERNAEPLRSTATRTPPSRNLSVAARVVHKQNVPWLPFKSGTHMPESSTPENFSGGKVTGTRKMEQKTPASLSQCQKGLERRSCLICGLPRGMEYLPRRKWRLGPLIWAEERKGR